MPAAPRPGRATTAQKVRALGVYLLFALPLAAGLFLWSADFLATYHGTAVCQEPLRGSDGQGDRVATYVLARPGSGDLPVVLPTAAFAAASLPRCVRGVPPTDEVPEDAPTVHKDAFTLRVTVGSTSWPTLGPADILFPLLLVAMGLLVRNWFVTGSPVRLAGRVEPPPVHQQQSGRVAPVKDRGSVGPPPDSRRRRSRRKRR